MPPEKKVTQIEILRFKRDSQKICRCYDTCYEIDTANRLVYCRKCGAIVNPFDALREVARQHDRINSDIDRIRRQAEELDTYKPKLRVIREMEKNYYSGYPVCPKCHEVFDLKNIRTWINKKCVDKTDKEGGKDQHEGR